MDHVWYVYGYAVEFYSSLIFLWELGYPAQVESDSSMLWGELGAIFLWFVCVSALRLGNHFGFMVVGHDIPGNIVNYIEIEFILVWLWSSDDVLFSWVLFDMYFYDNCNKWIF